MAKETISQTEGLCKEVANCIRNAYDRGYKRGFNEGQAHQLASDDVFRESCEKSAYEKGLNDAWECCRKMEEILFNTTDEEFRKIFDAPDFHSALTHFDAKKCMQKIKEYEEKQKDEIKVGDEVIWNDSVKGIVIDIIDCNLRGFTSRLCPFEWRKEFCRRTGRHFDQITEVLEQLKGEG